VAGFVLDHPDLVTLMREVNSQDDASVGQFRMWPDVSPGKRINVFYQKNGEVKLGNLKWGWGDLYNARSETALSPKLNVWSDAIVNARCLVPASMFWEGGARFRLPVKMPMLLAGLAYKNEAVSILTQPANAEIKKFHHRMPVIIATDRWRDWLDPRTTDVTSFITNSIILEKV
jgi:putative SOS response-associated peptidase YedK